MVLASNQNVSLAGQMIILMRSQVHKALVFSRSEYQTCSYFIRVVQRDLLRCVSLPRWQKRTTRGKQVTQDTKFFYHTEHIDDRGHGGAKK